MMTWSFQEFLYSQQVLVWQAPQAHISFADFWQKVADQAVYLQQQPQVQYALWTEDSYLFLTWFWASLIAKKHLVLPPNRIASLEQQFNAQGIQFIDETVEVSASSQTIEAVVEDWHSVLFNSQIIFFTSGSTGQPKQITRYAQQLLKEVQGLQTTFSLDERAVMLASVSHQHIYGLLFKLLLPLMSGRCFYRQQLLYPEYILNLQQSLQQQGFVPYLVASPALLKRCVGSFDFAASPLIFSSGGKLDAGIRQHYPVQIAEILGSSETGGIATRFADENAWQCFADVRIKVDAEQHLWVKTAHAYQDDWISTGDLAQLSEAGFQLLGRHDRIVKLEEKRLSLDAIEQKITQLDMVQQSYVLLHQAEQREMLAAVVVLTPAMQQELHQQGKKAFVERLKQQLSGQLESIAIPRLWRFVAEIPSNAQAKIDKSWVQNLFRELKYPIILEQQQLSEKKHYRLQFLPELLCYAGHFPQFPVYPGVGQIAFLVKFAQQCWSDFDFCMGYEQLKFQDLIKPYDVLNLSMHRQDNKIIFTLLHPDTRKIASGRLVFKAKEMR